MITREEKRLYHHCCCHRPNGRRHEPSCSKVITAYPPPNALVIVLLHQTSSPQLLTADKCMTKIRGILRCQSHIRASSLVSFRMILQPHLITQRREKLVAFKRRNPVSDQIMTKRFSSKDRLLTTMPVMSQSGGYECPVEGARGMAVVATKSSAGFPPHHGNAYRDDRSTAPL